MKNKRGRPPLDSVERRSYRLSAVLRDGLKQQLAAAAQASGRTISNEAEHRIERTFRDDEVMRELASLRAILSNGHGASESASHFASLIGFAREVLEKWATDVDEGGIGEVALHHGLGAIRGSESEPRRLVPLRWIAEPKP